MRPFVLAVLLGVAIVAPARALADPPAEAMDLYRRGRALYNEGRYREAVEEFQRAHAIDPAAPMLVYNIAVVYERLADLDRALQYYRLYLRFRIPVDERRRVEAIVRRIAGARIDAIAPATPAASVPSEAGDGTQQPLGQPQPQSQMQTQPAPFVGRADTDVLAYRPSSTNWAGWGLPPPERTDRTDRTGRPPSGWFWASAGTSAALFVAGGVLGILALQADGDARAFVVGSQGTLDDRQGLVDRAHGLALATDVTVGAALACAVAAIVVYVARL